jgi:murein DD-endopeptidase MepM/ murein hydrolase activator NlpD
MRWNVGVVLLAIAATAAASLPAAAAPPTGNHPAAAAAHRDKSAKPPRLAVSSKQPKPGQPVLVTVTGVDEAPRGTGGKVTLRFFPVKRGWQAVFTVPLEGATEVEVKIMAGGAALAETLTLAAATFAEEKVTVPPELAEPPADKRKVIDADNSAVLAAFEHDDGPLWTSAFKRPVGRMTSPFGSWRTLNDDYRSRHLGLDVGARKGAPVRAIQAGRVTLVREGFLMGGTVVVVHGGGIASAYFHVSDPAVAVGDAVKKNAVLGKVGLTGRTTGPHIHVGVWLPGGFADPATFFKLAIAAPKKPPAAAPATPSAKK